MFFENILKMTLTGKAQVAADFAQGFVGIAKQRLRFPQAAKRDVGSNAHTQLPAESLKQIGSAFPRESDYIICTDGFIDMGRNKLHTGIHFFGYALRQLLLGYPLNKVHGHHILQILDSILGLQLFTFLNVGIDEPVGLLHIQTAGDGGRFSDHSDPADEDVLCLPEGTFRQLTLLRRGQLGGGKK